MSVVYTNFGGMLLHENRGGTERQYVSDPLGSLVGELDSTQATTYTAEYWPYGEVQIETGSNTSPWNFVGLLGYLRDLAQLLYVRARHYLNAKGRWLTTDPLWHWEEAYGYVNHQPTLRRDPSGLAPWKCERCAAALFLLYIRTKEHDCCHEYIHCLVCCILTHEFDADCARSAQDIQNNVIDKGGGVAGFRMAACEKGIKSNVATKDCSDFCAKAAPCDNGGPSCDPPVKKPSWPWGGHLPMECYNCSPILKILPGVWGLGG